MKNKFRISYRQKEKKKKKTKKKQGHTISFGKLFWKGGVPPKFAADTHPNKSIRTSTQNARGPNYILLERPLPRGWSGENESRFVGIWRHGRANATGHALWCDDDRKVRLRLQTVPVGQSLVAVACGLAPAFACWLAWYLL